MYICWRPILENSASGGQKRFYTGMWSWAHKFAVSWNRISIVTGYRFGICGPFPLPSTYQVMPALGVFLGGVWWGGVTHEEKLVEKAASKKIIPDFRIWSAYDVWETTFHVSCLSSWHCSACRHCLEKCKSE